MNRTGHVRGNIRGFDGPRPCSGSREVGSLAEDPLIACVQSRCRNGVSAMSSSAMVLAQHPGRLTGAAGRTGPVSTETTVVVEIRIAIHAGPEGADTVRALIDRLSSIGARATVLRHASSPP